jgi:hypothetical protein
VSAPLKLQARLFYAIEKAVLSVYSAIANKVLWALQKMVEAIGGVAGVAKHLPLVGGAFKKVQSAAQAAADEIGSIRSAIDSLPTRKTVKINVIANDQGSLVGDNKPAGRGGASLPRSFTGKGARSIANEIIRTGRAAGASDKQILAALEAGIVESGLRNLSYGDRDSVGVFQQRPSQGWTGLMNVTKAAKEFFQHAKNADRGGLSAGQLAQAVQRSKYPGRYDQVRNKALGYLRGSGAGTTKQGTFNTGSTGGAGGKRNPKLEQMSLDSAINWLKKNFPGIAYLLEDKGGANQHLHINSTNHKQIRAIARALEEMGFDVGEYGGKPIPGVGGITTLKHKHYGAADHYHGGAIDINADNELVRAFGIAVKQKGSRRPQTFRAPVLGNKDFLDFIQGRIEHFDLMVRAGLMSATKAVLKKRDAIKSRLGLLTGDAKLEALAMLRELPVPKPQPKTFNIANQRNLAVAFAQKNPGFMPEGGWQRLGVDMTSNNPWLQAALTHTQSLVSAGHLSPAQGDALTKGYLQNALPFLQGDDKLAVESLLKQIATNTADTAHAVAQQAISDAGFFGSLTGPAADAVRGVLASNGIDVTPGGVSAQATIGNPQAASGLATSDIAELMSEVRSGAATFTDVWPQIMADLGVIAGATQETADNTQQQLDAIKEENRQLRQRLGVSQAQYAVLNGTRGMARNASRGLPGRGGGS